MARLTDTQLIILAAAAKRDDSAVLPLPKKLKIKNNAAENAFKHLIKKKLVAEQPTTDAAASWRKTGDGQQMTLVITPAGLKAIGADANDASAPERVEISLTRKSKNGKQQSPKLRQSRASSPSHGRTAVRPEDASSPGLRPNSKQAKLVDLLGRPQGASIAEMMKATGWQAHSVRGVMSGALKKKLSLDVLSEKTEAGGRRYRIAK